MLVIALFKILTSMELGHCQGKYANWIKWNISQEPPIQYTTVSNLTFEIMAKQGLRGGENGLLGYIRRTTTLLRLEGY